MADATHILQNVSTLIAWASISSIVAHAWATRRTSQPHLMYSAILSIVALGMSLPYNWEKPLARYRLIGALVLWLAAALLLVHAVAKGYPAAK